MRTTKKCKKTKSHFSVLKIARTQNAFPSPRVDSNSHHIVLCITSHSKFPLKWTRIMTTWLQQFGTVSPRAPVLWHSCLAPFPPGCSMSPNLARVSGGYPHEFKPASCHCTRQQLAAWNYNANEACELLSWTWLW